MDDKKFRAKQIINYLIHKGVAGTQSEIGGLLGYSNESYFSQIINGGKPLSDNVLKKLASLDDKINLDWLITGEGEMIVDKRSNASLYTPKHIISVPVVPYAARAGSLSEYEQTFSDESHEQQPVYLDEMPRGKYLVFTIGGDSMEDEFRDGDRVLARHINFDLWKDCKLHLRKWSVFVIVTRSEGILIKNITEHDVANHTIVCHSYNPNYEDIKVDLTDVIDIYNVVQLVRRSY